MEVFVGLCHRQMGMAQCKIQENVQRAKPTTGKVHADAAPEGQSNGPHGVCPANVPQSKHCGLHIKLLLEDIHRVQDGLPSKSHKLAGQWHKQLALMPNEPAGNATHSLRLLAKHSMKRHQRKRLKINIVLQLLWGRMMTTVNTVSRRRVSPADSLVLAAPPTRAHAASHSVEHLLDSLVQLDVSSETIVSSLMHQPASTPLDDA